MSKINNINRRKFLEIFGSCSCGIALAACSTAPITDRKQLKLIPETTLNRQAAQIYENVKKKTSQNQSWAKSSCESFQKTDSNFKTRTTNMRRAPLGAKVVALIFVPAFCKCLQALLTQLFQCFNLIYCHFSSTDIAVRHCSVKQIVITIAKTPQTHTQQNKPNT